MQRPAKARGRIEALSRRNLFQELLDLRDQQRRDAQDALWVIGLAETPIEVSDLGRVRWYLHPNLTDTAIRSLIVTVQEMQPRERSARLLHQGGSVIYFLDGSGKTVLDGETYEWKAGDVMNTPIREGGIDIQHFNTGSEVARFIEASPNLVHAIGVDRGSGFEVLEPAKLHGVGEPAEGA